MPKAWSEREKEIIHRTLRQEGRKLFEKYGLRKTTVDDIVRAARISKGAFYSFYESKEELYFRIVVALEEEYHRKLYAQLLQAGVPRRECFRSFLRDLIDLMTTVPIYRRLDAADYQYLLRKLPEDTLQAHVKGDFEELTRHFGAWMERGWMRRVDPGALNGLFLSLFYFLMHREDLGGAGFEAAKELWIDMLSEYLVPQEERAG